MKQFQEEELKKIVIPAQDSHKGQNGRLLIIGGSHLFHSASLWALTVASRLVDLVHYSSVPSNNAMVERAKEEFRNGIVIPRQDIESYIEEDDAILAGPGMVRADKVDSRKSEVESIKEIDEIEDEGMQTYLLTNYLLRKYPQKQWFIDAGSLQMLDLEAIPPNAILTPHHGEWEGLWSKYIQSMKYTVSGMKQEHVSMEDKVRMFAKEYQCIVVVKGERDIVSSGDESYEVTGGNVGMTKGGTGDVLAGLIAGLACKNSPLLSALAGSYINKKAGDSLYETVGPFFNATDLANEIPKVMKELLVKL